MQLRTAEGGRDRWGRLGLGGPTRPGRGRSTGERWGPGGPCPGAVRRSGAGLRGREDGADPGGRRRWKEKNCRWDRTGSYERQLTDGSRFLGGVSDRKHCKNYTNSALLPPPVVGETRGWNDRVAGDFDDRYSRSPASLRRLRPEMIARQLQFSHPSVLCAQS